MIGTEAWRGVTVLVNPPVYGSKVRKHGAHRKEMACIRSGKTAWEREEAKLLWAAASSKQAWQAERETGRRYEAGRGCTLVASGNVPWFFRFPV